MTNLGLIPIPNFGIVNSGLRLYRSAQPLHKHQYHWLVNMVGLMNIIDLRAESDHDEKHAPAFGIKVYKVPVLDHQAPTIDQVRDFSTLIKRLVPAPTLIHCEHGHGRTSTFTVLAEIALGSTLDDAMKREKDEFHYEWKHPVQEQFLRDWYASINNTAGVTTS